MSMLGVPADWRRLRPLTLLRPFLTGAALLTVYYLLPLDRGGNVAGLVVGLIALTVLVIWQVRAVMNAPSPRLRAVESLATSIPLYIVLFAGSYYTMSGRDADAFTEPLDRTDALYFTIATLATVGFGDIAAVSEPARAVVIVQMVTGVVLLGVVIKVFLGAVQIGLRRAQGAPAARGQGPSNPAADPDDGAPPRA
ncbi:MULTISPECIES: potassium channel family protein [Citricoccus]|uniref:potassium channel family protein n=1 Tax=Citricoccus TaxID=169133 RepID=UPI00031C0057|nr:potassium channel family protein [Citricoccus sp. CH26A]